MHRIIDLNPNELCIRSGFWEGGLFAYRFQRDSLLRRERIDIVNKPF